MSGRWTARVAGATAVVVVLAAGLWFWAGVVAPGYFESIAAGVIWFVVVSVAVGRIGKRQPAVRRAMRWTFSAATVATLAVAYWTSVRETRVDEPLETGVPASRLAPDQAPAVGNLLAPQP